MAPRTLYANLTDGLQPFSLWDQSLADMGLLGTIPCTAAGANAIVLTPLTSAFAPTVIAYSNYLRFSFVPAGASTGSVTAAIGTLAALNVYKYNGTSVVQVGSGDIVAGVLYVLVYSSALNSNVGGFYLLQVTAGTSTLNPMAARTTKANLTSGSAVPTDATSEQMLAISGSSYARMWPSSSQGSGAWNVVDPWGNVISTAGTTTQGLQEAITTAFANKWTLYVIGPGTITCSTVMTIPAGYFRNLVIDVGVTINFAALGAANLITIDSQENSVIRILGQVSQHAGDTGACIAINPTNAAPITGNINIAATTIEINSVAPATGGGAVLIVPTSGGIVGNRIQVYDPNGGLYGIKITNPGTAFIAVEDNTFQGYYLHQQSAFVIQFGTSTTNQTAMRRNTWFMSRLAPNGASCVVISSYASSDLYFIGGISSEEGAYDKGIVFQSGADNNKVFAGTITGFTTSEYVDTDNANTIFSTSTIKLQALTRVQVDTGTKTATATAGAATLNKMAGVVTSEALTTAGLADYTLTLTNSNIAAADQVMVSVGNGTNTQGDPVMGVVTPGSGTATIVVRNAHATQAFNGTLKISFVIFKN